MRDAGMEFGKYVVSRIKRFIWLDLLDTASRQEFGQPVFATLYRDSLYSNFMGRKRTGYRVLRVLVQVSRKGIRTDTVPHFQQRRGLDRRRAATPVWAKGVKEACAHFGLASSRTTESRGSRSTDHKRSPHSIPQDNQSRSRVTNQST